jgi:zinc protease
MIWPTTDDRDQATALRLALLARVARIALTDRLREELGQTYSPSAGSSTSRIYPGYGTFTLSSTAAAGAIASVRDAMRGVMADLAARPVDADLLERAARPLLESYDNALKDLGGWVTLASRAQSEPERLARWQAAPALIRAITPDILQQTAQTYLGGTAAPVEVLVLPEPAAETVVPDAAK